MTIYIHVRIIKNNSYIVILGNKENDTLELRRSEKMLLETVTERF